MTKRYFFYLYIAIIAAFIMPLDTYAKIFSASSDNSSVTEFGGGRKPDIYEIGIPFATSATTTLYLGIDGGAAGTISQVGQSCIREYPDINFTTLINTFCPDAWFDNEGVIHNIGDVIPSGYTNFLAFRYPSSSVVAGRFYTLTINSGDSSRALIIRSEAGDTITNYPPVGYATPFCPSVFGVGIECAKHSAQIYNLVSDTLAEVISPSIQILSPENGAIIGDFLNFKLFVNSSGTNLSAMVEYGKDIFTFSDREPVSNGFAFITKLTPLASGTYTAQPKLFEGTSTLLATGATTTFTIFETLVPETGTDSGAGDTFGFIFNIREQISKKPPFGYFTLIKDAFESKINQTSSIELISTSSLAAFSAIFNPLNTGLSLILWFFAGTWLFFRIKHLDI